MKQFRREGGDWTGRGNGRGKRGRGGGKWGKREGRWKREKERKKRATAKLQLKLGILGVREGGYS